MIENMDKNILTNLKYKKIRDNKENTEKDSKEPEAENTDAKDIREVSGQNVKVTASRWYQNPFTWIAVIAVLAVAGLLIYHNKKK